MKVKILGTQTISFVSSSGEAINGINIFAAFKDENVVGHRCEKFFVRENIPFTAKAEDTVEISFNHKGKIESITKIN